MNCAGFDRRLDGLLEGTCSRPEWEEAEGHARSCQRCAPLLDALAGGGEKQNSSDAETLAEAVIARTSGSTCKSARDRLPSLVDGELRPFERQLVEGHLSRCGECSRLAEALALASAILPTFAELRPPVALLPGVVAATSRRPPIPTPIERLTAWFERLASRPRFSLEVAYTLTLLLALVFGNPVAAFKETSARSLAYAQPRVEGMVERVASGPLGTAKAIREGLAERAGRSALAPKAGILTRLVASLDGEWKWFTSYVVGPLRDAGHRLLDWVRTSVAPNPSSAARVTQTGGTTERPEGEAPLR